MILYLDTSALVKLYVPEPDSAIMKQLVDIAELPAMSRVSYVEARAAFARKRREQAVSLKDYRTIVQDFDNDLKLRCSNRVRGGCNILND